MTPIKTGIIGFGRMASNHHLTAMRESGLYEVTAVCDITESRRQAAVEEGLTATDDLDAFLDSDLELVLITTHSSLHYESALKVAAAKKHMLIEKPLAVRGQQLPDVELALAVTTSDHPQRVLLVAVPKVHLRRTARQSARHHDRGIDGVRGRQGSP